ncbi:hypothetical protein Tco_1187038 [Tanacetum coccineum]
MERSLSTKHSLNSVRVLELATIQVYLGLHNRTALSKDETKLLWKLLVQCLSLQKLQCSFRLKLCPLRVIHLTYLLLCYPINDYDDLGKLKAKADIGIFVGYAPTKKAYRIYNKRTRKIQETVHVTFDELTEGMTSVQPSTGLRPKSMAPGHNDEEFPLDVYLHLVNVAHPHAPEIASDSPSTTTVTKDAPATTTITSPS